MNDVLLDLNVVLDVFLIRQPWVVEAEAVLEANREGRITAYFSSASVPTLFYVVRKQRDLALAHLAVADCLRSLTIVPIDYSTLELARTLPGPDFEDNLQIACAVQAKLGAIITRDATGFTSSPIIALTPSAFLAQMTPAP